MGIYDRDYVRNDSRGGFASLGVWSVTTWLIVINVAPFFVDGALSRSRQRSRFDDFDEPAPQIQQTAESRWTIGMSPLQWLGHFSIDKAIKHAQVWRLLTFQFVYESPFHLAINMLGLFLFGSIVEGHFGPRRYLAYYLMCGVAGALTYVLLWATRLIITNPSMPLLGASAGVMGVLVGAAIFAPDMEIFAFIVPVKLRVLAWLMLALAAYTVVSNGFNAGAEAAHLGGGLLGLAFVNRQDLLNFAVPTRRSMHSTRPGARRRQNRVQKDWSKDFNR